MNAKRPNFFEYTIAAVIISIIFVSFAISTAKAKVFIICTFKSQDIQPYNNAINGFVEELKANGYYENKDFILLNFDMNADEEEGRRMAGAIREQKPDLVLAVGNEAAQALKDAIKDTPVIYSVVQDPVGNGLIQNLNYSGNNLTGSSVDVSDEQQLKVLRTIFPKAQKIGVIFDPEKSQQKVDQVSKSADNPAWRLMLTKEFSL